MAFEEALYAFAETRHPAIFRELAEKKAIGDTLRSQMDTCIAECKAEFLATRKTIKHTRDSECGMRNEDRLRNLPFRNPRSRPMATLRDIRRRIASVKSTQQITRAMKLVAAAKLRRAQERILEARPYCRSMGEVVSGLALAVAAGVAPAAPGTGGRTRSDGDDPQALARHQRRPGTLRRVQQQHHPAIGGPPAGRAGQPGREPRLDRGGAQGPGLLPAARGSHGALRIRELLRQAGVRPRGPDRPGRGGSLRRRRGGRGPARLQRVSLRRFATSGGRNAPADPVGGRTGRDVGGGISLRAVARRRPGNASCPSTWRCRSIAP